ncbi:Phytochelatin synthase-domain-containing protein [Chytridium lagenaria]|nr:Phytochelatin synthase-domain-containing protein [Chytridium lagenaria]
MGMRGLERLLLKGRLLLSDITTTAATTWEVANNHACNPSNCTLSEAVGETVRAETGSLVKGLKAVDGRKSAGVQADGGDGMMLTMAAFLRLLEAGQRPLSVKRSLSESFLAALTDELELVEEGSAGASARRRAQRTLKNERLKDEKRVSRLHPSLWGVGVDALLRKDVKLDLQPLSREIPTLSTSHTSGSFPTTISLINPTVASTTTPTTVLTTANPTTASITTASITTTTAATTTATTPTTTPPPTSSPTFYKRPLPETCIAFQSPHGKSLFRRAITRPYMETYYPLSMHYTTQSEPAYCGLTTLTMVLNTLEVDPLRRWKGCWRWFDEDMLEFCRPIEEIRREGITLPEFECMARCNGLETVTKRADGVTKEVFIDDIKKASKSRSEIMVVSYSRNSLNQTGTGHFSPIGGYDEEENKVLIFDVARFKYPAYWVSVDLLWESIHPVDESTGKPRGYTLLKRASRGMVHSALARIATEAPNAWPKLAKALVESTPEASSTQPDVQETLQRAFTTIPTEIFEALKKVVNTLTLFTPPFDETRGGENVGREVEEVVEGVLGTCGDIGEVVEGIVGRGGGGREFGCLVAMFGVGVGIVKRKAGWKGVVEREAGFMGVQGEAYMRLREFEREAEEVLVGGVS